MNYEDMKAALTSGSGSVEIDEGTSFAVTTITHPPLTDSVAPPDAAPYAARLSTDGEVVALTSLTPEQARHLLSIGARWVGEETHRP